MQSEQRPLVSVLTPSFNQGRFIRDCIESVAAQSYRPIEHIIVDGGSTDETLSILQSAPEHVCWVSEPDRGQSHALNKALAMSRGEIIGWVNSDDAYADRRAVERAVETFAAKPEVGLVYGHALMIDARNRILQYLWAPPFARGLLNRLTAFSQPAVLLRRSALPQPFVREDLHFVMDYDLWLRLAKTTAFQRLDLLVGVDRHHGGRKVESAAFGEEFRAYYQQVSRYTLADRLLVKAIKIGMRLCGLPAASRLPSGLEPALPLDVGSSLSRALRQGAVPRRFMS